MIALKNIQVDPTGIKPEMVFAVMVAESIFRDHGHDCIVTSINDSSHSPKSKHWVGLAVDLRSRHVYPVDVRQIILSRLKYALPGFDVLLENQGTVSEHYHIEYDPVR